MGLYTVNSLSLSKIGDILREQLGDSASGYTFPDDFLTAIANINFKAIVYNGDSAPYDMVVVGDALTPSFLYSSIGNASPKAQIKSIRCVGELLSIPAQMFMKQTGLESCVIPSSCSSIGQGAFTDSGLTEFVQNCDLDKSATAIGASAFLRCSSMTNCKLANTNALPSTNYQTSPFGSCTSLKTIQIGDVGRTVTAIPNQSFYSCTQSDLTITVYTLGGNVSSFLTNIRNGATDATVVFKASVATSYNGQSYSAGQTMLTSTPT